MIIYSWFCKFWKGFWIGFWMVLDPRLFWYISHLTFIYQCYKCHLSNKVYGIYFGNEWVNYYYQNQSKTNEKQIKNQSKNDMVWNGKTNRFIQITIYFYSDHFHGSNKWLKLIWSNERTSEWYNDKWKNIRVAKISTHNQT